MSEIQTITVGSRRSPLAQVQVSEVLLALNKFHPQVSFDTLFVDSIGDIDKNTSLRSLEKTDFFTREIDAMQLAGKCQISIHSAKDLPDPIPEGLEVVAITQGVDPSDSLVLREGITLETMKEGILIATSSARREEAVQALKPGFPFRFRDIRGTIAERLAHIDRGEADGVVVAEAALIRLGLTGLNRLRLPGDTTPLQGQLAILARSGDLAMRELFSCLDSRVANKVLYTGLELPDAYKRGDVVHCPLIEIAARGREEDSIRAMYRDIDHYTHIIFTSKSAVSIFFEYAASYGVEIEMIKRLCVVAVGWATAEKIRSYGVAVKRECVATDETAEGVIDVLSGLALKGSGAKVLWPHAAGARRVIPDWFQGQEGISDVGFEECVLYDTVAKDRVCVMAQVPNLSSFNEVVFTSPSTVDAFESLYGDVKRYSAMKFTTKGPVTAARFTIGAGLS